MGLRLGFYYHSPVECRADGVYMLGYVGRFVDSVARRCDELVCFHHQARADERPLLDHQLAARNVHVVDLGQRGTAFGRSLRPARFTDNIRSHLDGLDALLIRGPSPLLPALARASTVPVALLLVGDYLSGVRELRQPAWRRVLISAWARWNRWQQTRATRGALTFVNSQCLFQLLEGKAARLVLAQTTTLEEKDFFERDDTCLRPPYRLLYTGRMVRSKGVFELTDAVRILVERGRDVRLELVGWADRGEESTIRELEAFVDEAGITERVRIYGFVPLGPELFCHYREADLYVLASHGEGFPRSIWEAMAHSVPVVATRVGGIPFTLEDGVTARLVPPGDSASIANAVEAIIDDAGLRRALIKNGWRLVRRNTLSQQAEAITTRIKEWIADPHAR